MSFGVIPRNGVSLGIGASPTLAKPPPWASLRLNFAETASLDSSITFTRGTNATYTNSAGNVQLTAGVNDARFDYDPVTLACKGLLIEEARTNSLTYSEQFDNAAWAKTTTTVTANATTAPDGTVTADKCITNNAAPYGLNSYFFAFTPLTKYTFSVYLKAAELTTAQIDFYTVETGDCGFSINLATGVIGATFGTLDSYGVTSAGNGWYRAWAVKTTAATVTSGQVQAYRSLVTGDGTSGYYTWGAQLEAGAFPTSYIPTTTAAATRNADNAVMTGTNFSSWYNQTQGTLFAQVVYYAELIASAAGTNNIFVDDSSNLNFVAIRTVSNPTNPQADISVYSGGVSQVDTAGAQPVLANTTYKRAFAFALNNMQAYVNAVTDGGAITSALMPVGVNRLVIGSGSLTAMWIASISYYPTRLPNATLQALTV